MSIPAAREDPGVPGERARTTLVGRFSAGAHIPALPRTAWLAIDLDRLAGNLACFRAALPDGVRIEAVVKSDAYGHGAVPVARTLVAAGADGCCVATFDEAVELRRGGVGGPILVLFPIPPELVVEAARLDISIVAGDAALLDRTLAAVASEPTADALAGRYISIHLEIETGLGRCGVAPGEAAAAAASIEATPGARLAGLWSHLSSAGDAARTSGQEEQLRTASRLLDDAAVRLPRRHLAASGGVLAASAPSYDAVRIGLSLYGLLPDGLAIPATRSALAEGLRPVLSLRARPIRVADLPAGTGISYGPSFVTRRPSRVATLPIGYGDGYARSLSNSAAGLVRGMRVPIIGTVAMDAVMVDVTDVPGEPVTIDDEFVLVGEQDGLSIPIAELAQQRNTISYEVVTSLSRRLTRVYYAAANPVGLRTLTEERGEWRASSSGTGTSATSRSTSSSTPRT